MRCTRLRIKLQILATPLYRSQNLRYPYYKEFYGYMQSFFQNVYVCETAIHYTESFVYDYWNQHGLVALQIVNTLQRLKANLEAHSELSVANSGIAAPEFPQAVTASLNTIRSLELGFTLGSTLLPDGSVALPGSINTFNTPINLLRFKFEIGTIFKVTLQRWTMPLAEGGNEIGNSTVEAPYDTENPNAATPTPSGARDPNGQPYGPNPPGQSPIDLALDPDDFNNPPNPADPTGTISLQGWRTTAIPSQQGEVVFITCPAATLAAGRPSASGYVEPIANLGVRSVAINAEGRILITDLKAVFPEYVGTSGTNASSTSSCGVNGFIR